MQVLKYNKAEYQLCLVSCVRYEMLNSQLFWKFSTACIDNNMQRVVVSVIFIGCNCYGHFECVKCWLPVLQNAIVMPVAIVASQNSKVGNWTRNRSRQRTTWRGLVSEGFALDHLAAPCTCITVVIAAATTSLAEGIVVTWRCRGRQRSVQSAPHQSTSKFSLMVKSVLIVCVE